MLLSLLPVWLRVALVAAATLFILATPTKLHASLIDCSTLTFNAGSLHFDLGYKTRAHSETAGSIDCRLTGRS